MKKWQRRSLWVLLMVMILLTGGLGWYVYQAVPIGTGYAAKYVCSSVFISKRDPATVFQDDILPVDKTLTRIIDVEVDYTQKAVTAKALGVWSSKAIYREGCGCTLVVSATEEALRRQPLPAPAPRRLPGKQPWPDGEAGPGLTRPAGWDEKKLQQAMDRHFAEPGPEKKRQTRALVVIYDGQLVAERYAPGFHKDLPLLGWSMAKSVTSAILGIMVHKAMIDIRKPAPVPEWNTPGDPRRAITVDQLLRMSSGLKFEEVYKPLRGVTTMLYGSRDFGAFAAGQPLEMQPDRKWHYSSGTTNLLAKIIRLTLEAAGQNSLSFIRQELFDRLGMTSAVFELDPSGTFVGSSYLVATPRDWARFGLLYLRDGIWEGQRILPEGWVTYSTTPTPPAPRGQYGAHFWLNAGSPGHPADRVWPRLPADAYFADGYQGQRVAIVPSRKLVVVRFGLTLNPADMGFEAFLGDILEASPQNYFQVAPAAG
jgi:CubicO group peptidase (beta-lactamase class C family)